MLISVVAFFVDERESTQIPEASIKDTNRYAQKEQEVNLAQVLQLIRRNDTLLIDSRSPERYVQGHLPNAINIPYTADEMIAIKLIQSAKGYSNILIYCEGDNLLCQDARSLGRVVAKETGLVAMYYGGGYSEWLACDLKIERAL
jgi:rhodanese-related sulfurtransferase